MDPYNPQNPPEKRPYKKRKTYRQGWHLYRGAFISHHLQGFMVAILVLSETASLIAAGVLWAYLYTVYQVACFPRKKDSMGLDICDIMVGYVIGLITITPFMIF